MPTYICGNYIAGLEQERTRSKICRNWVIDCIACTDQDLPEKKSPSQISRVLPLIL